MDEFKCPLCNRDVPFLEEHHLVPKSRGGKNVFSICHDCHKQIHALFDNKSLEEDLYKYELLIRNERFIKYLKWISKRPYGCVHKARESRNRRRRG